MKVGATLFSMIIVVEKIQLLNPKILSTVEDIVIYQIIIISDPLHTVAKNIKSMSSEILMDVTTRQRAVMPKSIKPQCQRRCSCAKVTLGFLLFCSHSMNVTDMFESSAQQIGFTCDQIQGDRVDY